ncbi:ABC transporter substrate-binding protein [Tolumonas lignilytica]|uniref:ABC transporter substrate-binding protein n=1 Tax=Tolumonas lignilytica TaxID=1283284 RepID=UPI00046780EF|nr:ABC transporter substrate-binding protein [Tolumonas lignilytica]
MTLRSYLVSSLMLSLVSVSAMASSVEVLHWWTAGGEAKAADVFRSYWQALGNEWQDSAISGGGGQSAMTVLKSRALSGTPPEAAHLKGSELQEWAGLGFLRNLDEAARLGNWDNVLPEFVQHSVQYKGHYVAVPIGIHRVNWLWVNPKVLKRYHLSPPESWPQLLTIAKRLKQEGITPLAIGDDQWQLSILFEAIVLGEGGSDFYRRAFIRLDQTALQSETMEHQLELFHQLRDYIADDYGDTKWNQATHMLIEGSAAMQLMGDWVKGELTAASVVPGKDILCLPAPGTAGKFSYNLDSFAMFNVQSPSKQQAQLQLVNMIMTSDFQHAFNRVKGSIPVLRNQTLTDFDQCAQNSAQQLQLAIDQQQLVPSMAEGMANSSNVKQAIGDVLVSYFNDPKGNAKQAAHQLARAILSAQR